MGINTILSGLLWINLQDLEEQQIEKIRQSYRYPNPHEPEQIFETFIELPERIGVPFGNSKKASALLPAVTVKDSRVAPKFKQTCKFIGPNLRDYQEDAVKEVDKYLKDGGTTWNLAGKPGSGKSFMLAYLLSKLKIRTLVIAHLSMLTTQLNKELNDNLDADIRILNAKQQELGDINVATSQFISKNPDLWRKIKHDIGFIVVDEAETAASETTLRILQRAHAKYRMFISATFSRSVDERTEALLDLSGPKSIILERKDLLVPSIIGVECPEHFRAPQSKMLFKRFQTAFYERCRSIDDKVLQITQSALKKGRQVLVVTDIINMQIRYEKVLNDNGITTGILNGKTKVKDRNLILDEFDNGQRDVIIGAAVLNAGLSIPKISVIIRVSFANSPEKLTQLIGRSLRDYEGKQGAWFIDLNFTQGYWKRRQMYIASGFNLTEVTWDKFKEQL